MRRILSLWMPHWPIDRWYRSHSRSSPRDKVLVLTAHVNQAQKLYAVCPLGLTIGLQPGMTLAEARAIKPDINVEASDTIKDAISLEELARWLVRFSPLVAVDGKDCILIDITGCAHLFGGEPSLLTTIYKRFAQADIHVQAAIADTSAAAWAFAHFSAGTISHNRQHTLELLGSLPVTALRLDRASVQTLSRLGLKDIGSLLDLPRPALARRFKGKSAQMVSDLLLQLDLILGRRDLPISPLIPLPSWQAQQAFTEPVLHEETILLACEKVLSELAAALEKAEQGAMRIGLYAFRVDGSVQQIMVGTSHPCRDVKHLMRLLSEKTSTLEAGYGFDLISIKAYEVEHLPPVQINDIQDQGYQQASQILDRLSTRLGPGAVQRLKHQHSYLPERMQVFIPPGTDIPDWEGLPENLPHRPLRLLLRPETIDVLAEVPEGAPKRFRWRRMEHRVVKASGPERITPEWWNGEETHTRDYYKVEVRNGARFWLFRYGLYASSYIRPQICEDTASTPTWFLHGFFA